MVRGKAFAKKLAKPFLKFLLLMLSAKDIECLTECKKQKYIVKANKGSKFILRIIIVEESNKDKKIFLFIKKLLIRPKDIKATSMLLLYWLNSTSKISNICIVSEVWKYKGAEITKDPFKKKNKLFSLNLLIFPNTESSLPKW